MSPGQLPIGLIVGPQGVRGQFKVRSYTANPHSLSAYGPVITDDGQQLMLQIMFVNSKGLAVVRAKGVNSREASEALRGVTLYVSRNSLPRPDDGEFYHADLLGMVVKGQDSARLGSLIAIHDFGAGEIAELATGNGPTIMVPFGGDHLIAVDMAAKEICLSVPDGLLNDANTVNEAGVDKIGRRGKAEKNA